LVGGTYPPPQKKKNIKNQNHIVTVGETSRDQFKRELYSTRYHPMHRYPPRQDSYINIQRPLAGALKGLIYNGATRTSRYWFYWLPPTVGFYYIYKWLKEKYVDDHRYGLIAGMNFIIQRRDMLILRNWKRRNRLKRPRLEIYDEYRFRFCYFPTIPSQFSGAYTQC
jgi:hypothetical protein